MGEALISIGIALGILFLVIFVGYARVEVPLEKTHVALRDSTQYLQVLSGFGVKEQKMMSHKGLYADTLTNKDIIDGTTRVYKPQRTHNDD